MLHVNINKLAFIAKRTKNNYSSQTKSANNTLIKNRFVSGITASFTIYKLGEVIQFFNCYRRPKSQTCM